MGAPRSKQFNDVYFSDKDGLAETRHVFLDGNDLPQAFAGKDEFVIAETGFGTGLNFLAVWDLFSRVRSERQKLHFISVEKYPLCSDEIDAALEHFEVLNEGREALVSVYPDEPCDVFEYDFGGVKLTIYFGDVVDGLKRCDARVNAWFFDGFKPATNPEMWRDAVFEQVGRLSRAGTTFSTFTSAGFVRRGLDRVGFDVKRVSGFRYKRHMSVGVLR